MSETQPVAKHYPALDGLRGVAALMIVWHHYLQLVPAHGRVLSILTHAFEFSRVGVDLFFVLSGFLITGILADAKGQKHFFRTFYGRRTLRIFPLYYTVLIVVLLLLPLAGIETGVPHASEFSIWTYLSNFYFASHGWYANYLSHLWTLAIEEQFYFIWPLVIYAVHDLERLRRNLPWVFVGVLILRVVLYAVGFNSIFLSLVTFTHCDGLLLGGYLALVLRSRAQGVLAGLRPSRSLVIWLSIFTLILGYISGLVPEWEALPAVVFLRSVLPLSLVAILFVWLIYAAVEQESGRLYQFCSHRFVRWFGKYSYALYLLHVPVAFLIFQWFDLSHLSPLRALLAEIGLLVLYVGTCIGCAFLSWHLFEKHFLKLKRFLPYSSDRGNSASV